MSGFSFLALAAEVEGAGVLPVDEGVGGFSTFSLDFSFSLSRSASRSLGCSGREVEWVVEEVVEGLEWETDVLVWAVLDVVSDEDEGGLLGSPDVGRLGEGTLAPGIFRRFEGLGGVKAELDELKLDREGLPTPGNRTGGMPCRFG